MLRFFKNPTVSRYIIAAIFLTAGMLHFVKTRAYVEVMPKYIPWHEAMVLISGAAEIVGAIGILIPKTRLLAGWGLIILLIVVFPVNIQMAIYAYQQQQWSFKFILYLLRLPLQFVLIYWIYWATLKRPARF